MAHLAVDIEQYQRLSGQRRSLVDALSMPGLADIDFDPAAANFQSRDADFS